MGRVPETLGTIVRVTSWTPGLKANGTYEVVQVVEDRILGPLFRLRDMVSQELISDAYYPWRFNLMRDWK